MQIVGVGSPHAPWTLTISPSVEKKDSKSLGIIVERQKKLPQRLLSAKSYVPTATEYAQQNEGMWYDATYDI